MSSRFLLMLGLFLLATHTAVAAETTWGRNADWLEKQIAGCADGSDPDACRFFPARALSRLFGLDELCQDGSCVGPWTVAETVLDGNDWAELGSASEQTVLSMARDMATGGLPVIAVHGGMVALVMPGPLFPSQRWSRNVPLAVGARVDEPTASVYAKGLNFLFSDPSAVTLYVYK